MYKSPITKIFIYLLYLTVYYDFFLFHFVNIANVAKNIERPNLFLKPRSVTHTYQSKLEPKG